MDPLHHITPLAVATIILAVILTSLPPCSSAPASLPPYTNHTVGGPTGWLFDPKKNTSATDYSKWAKSQSFYLGDFLIFKTNTNMSVIQTYNKTTYRRCDASEDGSGDDTSIYASDRFGEAAVIAVPLTAEGRNYFFSGAEDGIQCVKGMRFQIAVEKGRGLPPDLSHPPPPPYVNPVAPPPPQTESGSVAGGSPQGEEFYTSGGDGGTRVCWGIWGFGFFTGVALLFCLLGENTDS